MILRCRASGGLHNGAIIGSRDRQGYRGGILVSVSVRNLINECLDSCFAFGEMRESARSAISKSAAIVECQQTGRHTLYQGDIGNQIGNVIVAKDTAGDETSFDRAETI